MGQLDDLVVGSAVHLKDAFNVPSKTTIHGLIRGSLITKDLVINQSGKL